MFEKSLPFMNHFGSLIFQKLKREFIVEYVIITKSARACQSTQRNTVFCITAVVNVHLLREKLEVNCTVDPRCNYIRRTYNETMEIRQTVWNSNYRTGILTRSPPNARDYPVIPYALSAMFPAQRKRSELQHFSIPIDNEAIEKNVLLTKCKLIISLMIPCLIAQHIKIRGLCANWNGVNGMFFN